MAKFECKVCGYIYNEQQAGRPFDELTECPICNEDKSNFKMLEEEEVFFEWADEDDDNIIDVEVRPIDEDDEPSVDEPAGPVEAVAEEIKQEEPAPAEEAVEETVVETAETVEEAVTETAEVIEEAAAETAEAVEESVVETVEAAEETVVETAEGTPVNPAAALMKDLETAKDINTEYVVERRQEFWSPFSGTKTEKTDKEETPVKKAWSIENAY
ncbi:MAG: hypothetical protein IKY53_05090, partial [Lachnospiraceae bacterium]|nr:hypothetical protein [Lachnospiraceae bacterium]